MKFREANKVDRNSRGSPIKGLSFPSLRMTRKRAAMVTKEILFPSLSTPSKNRTTVEVRSKLQGCLSTTTLLGLASVRSARALPPTTRKYQRLAA
jgi:hypothetical protein